MADLNYRDRAERRKSALKLERESFIPHYKELAQFIQPRRGRFFIQDRDRGGDRYNSIINSKATAALRVARSGMLAGAMSPSRPWMKLELQDDDLNAFQPTKVWLSKVAKVLYRIFNEGNLYQQAPSMLGELLLCGTGVLSHVDDFEDVARFYAFTMGSYMIGQDSRQVVNTLIREWEMSTLQIMEKFAKDDTGGKVSLSVQTAYDNGRYDQWFPVTQIVEPNIDYSVSKKLAKFKKFRSTYYEPGNVEKDVYLRDKGFAYFPFYCPRWDVTGEDIYGTDCPAMTALGDIKGLQIEERRKAQAIDKMVNPPLKGPASLRNSPIDSLPGGLTVYEGDGGKDGLGPLYMVNPQLGELRLDMKAVEDRIDNAFYAHLFRAISDMPGIQPKNQLELQQRDQERMLEIGPVLERLHGEFLAGLVNRTYAQALFAGILPPPPPEIQGKQIKTTFISALAQAQRSVAAGTIERTSTFIAGLVSAGFHQAMDKFNIDEAIDEYADVTGTPPSLIISTDDANRARQAQQQALAAQQKLAATNMAADTAQKGAAAAQSLGATPGVSGTGNNTLLQNVTEAVRQRGAANAFAQR
jgi:uncharacterized protein YdbL (DUF1318 family)